LKGVPTFREVPRPLKPIASARATSRQVLTHRPQSTQSSFFGEPPYRRDPGTPRQQELEKQLASFDHGGRIGSDDQGLLGREAAGRLKRRLVAVGDLDRAKPTSPKGLKALVLAERGDLDAGTPRGVKHGGTRLDPDCPAVDLEGYHAFHSLWIAPCLQTS